MNVSGDNVSNINNEAIDAGSILQGSDTLPFGKLSVGFSSNSNLIFGHNMSDLNVPISRSSNFRLLVLQFSTQEGMKAYVNDQINPIAEDNSLNIPLTSNNGLMINSKIFDSPSASSRTLVAEIKLFDDVDATKVVIRNTKLYVNREEGFIGTSLRKDEYVCDCSDIDDLIVFTKDCKVVITKVGSKTFIGKNIIHAAVFKKKDKRTIYNMIYKDGDKNFYYLKRFAVSGVTRDKVYDLSSAKKESVVYYFSANPNGEAEIVSLILRQSAKLKKFKANKC